MKSTAMQLNSFIPILAAVSLALQLGCAHRSDSISATQYQLDEYQERALAKLIVDGPLRQTRDPNRPIRYEFRGGRHPQVAVIIPVVSDRSNQYVEVEFDGRSGRISNVSQVLIH